MNHPYRDPAGFTPLCRWQHITFKVVAEDMEEVLNHFGRQGFEMVSQTFCDSVAGYRIWMKRQVP